MKHNKKIKFTVAIKDPKNSGDFALVKKIYLLNRKPTKEEVSNFLLGVNSLPIYKVIL